MAVNNGLLRIAAPLAGGVGSYQTLLHGLFSKSCIEAVAAESQANIDKFCPEGFNDFSLLVIISIGVAGVILAVAWKDILQAAWEKLTSSA